MHLKRNFQRLKLSKLSNYGLIPRIKPQRILCGRVRERFIFPQAFHKTNLINFILISASLNLKFTKKIIITCVIAMSKTTTNRLSPEEISLISEGLSIRNYGHDQIAKEEKAYERRLNKILGEKYGLCLSGISKRKRGK